MAGSYLKVCSVYEIPPDQMLSYNIPELQHDHAIDRFNDLRANYYRYFRFNSRFAAVAISSLIVIPGICLYTFADQHDKWDWRGKKRGESLARSA
ncbi:hypothetical protein NM688_g9237 [Phlebia brevispora]|uniref:Uncharacterized protein n=1 Tax=Phlebia brevispora TaxID=194682 RepID=A0ACC1RLF4_9APHY|nr:hypothetical protein NM688_g9237 [Phlebia brevispora]